MKKFFFFACMTLASITANAQHANLDEETKITTEYPTYQKATVYTQKGDSIKMMGNIFLKDGSFIYPKGNGMLRAKTSTIKRVVFPDKEYYNCDTMLAKVVYKYEDNMLLQSRLIDMTAWVRRMQNSQDISSLTLRDFVQFTTVDNTTFEDNAFPVIRDYFFVYNNEVIPASDRIVWRKIPKDKRKEYKRMTSYTTFNWHDMESLKSLLKFITDIQKK